MKPLSVKSAAGPSCQQAQEAIIGITVRTAFAVSIWIMNREIGQQTAAA